MEDPPGASGNNDSGQGAKVADSKRVAKKAAKGRVVEAIDGAGVVDSKGVRAPAKKTYAKEVAANGGAVKAIDGAEIVNLERVAAVAENEAAHTEEIAAKGQAVEAIDGAGVADPKRSAALAKKAAVDAEEVAAKGQAVETIEGAEIADLKKALAKKAAAHAEEVAAKRRAVGAIDLAEKLVDAIRMGVDDVVTSFNYVRKLDSWEQKIFKEFSDFVDKELAEKVKEVGKEINECQSMRKTDLSMDRIDNLVKAGFSALTKLVRFTKDIGKAEHTGFRKALEEARVKLSEAVRALQGKRDDIDGDLNGIYYFGEEEHKIVPIPADSIKKEFAEQRIQNSTTPKLSPEIKPASSDDEPIEPANQDPRPLLPTTSPTPEIKEPEHPPKDTLENGGSDTGERPAKRQKIGPSESVEETEDGSKIRVEIRREDMNYEIELEDSGPGNMNDGSQNQDVKEKLKASAESSGQQQQHETQNIARDPKLLAPALPGPVIQNPEPQSTDQSQAITTTARGAELQKMNKLATDRVTRSAGKKPGQKTQQEGSDSVEDSTSSAAPLANSNDAALHASASAKPKNRIPKSPKQSKPSTSKKSAPRRKKANRKNWTKRRNDQKNATGKQSLFQILKGYNKENTLNFEAQTQSDITKLSLRWLRNSHIICYYNMQSEEHKKGLPQEVREFIGGLIEENEEKGCLSHTISVEDAVKNPNEVANYRKLQGKLDERYHQHHPLPPQLPQASTSSNIPPADAPHPPTMIKFSTRSYLPIDSTAAEVLDSVRRGEEACAPTSEGLFREDSDVVDEEKKFFTDLGATSDSSLLCVPIIDANVFKGAALKNEVMKHSLCIVRNGEDAWELDLKPFGIEKLRRKLKDRTDMDIRLHLPQPACTNFIKNGGNGKKFPNEIVMTSQMENNTPFEKFAEAYTEQQELTKKCYEELVKNVKNHEKILDDFEKELKNHYMPSKFLTNLDLVTEGAEDQFSEELKNLDSFPYFLHYNSGYLGKSGEILRGLNMPQEYLKFPGVRTGPHPENNALTSVNHNIGPGINVWFGVPLEHSARFEAFLFERIQMESGGQALDENAIYTTAIWPNVAEMEKRKIPYYKFLQNPGDMVLVNYGAYHWVQANGCSINISWNVAQPTNTQLQLSGIFHDRYAECGVQCLMAIEHIIWNVAESEVELDEATFKTIRSMLIKSMAHMEQEFLYVEKMKKMGVKSEESYEDQFGNVERCMKCRKIMFNHIAVLEGSEEKVLHCLQCSHQNIKSYTVYFLTSMEEWVKVFDEFTWEKVKERKSLELSTPDSSLASQPSSPTQPSSFSHLWSSSQPSSSSGPSTSR